MMGLRYLGYFGWATPQVWTATFRKFWLDYTSDLDSNIWDILVGLFLMFGQQYLGYLATPRIWTESVEPTLSAVDSAGWFVGGCWGTGLGELGA
jgi:hypothetical protein